MLSTKCFQAKAGQLKPQWYVIDAADQVVGRLAAQIAPILMGKHRPTYTPHIDTGDYVIVVNVEKVVFTGSKWQQKVYQRYSGYPGGQKEEPAWRVHQRHPERILYEAIRRMMPKNKIGRNMLSKLKLVVGSNHPHQAQQPIPLEPLVGRPAASGILLAPPPRPKAKTKRKPTVDATPAAEAPTPAPPATGTPVPPVAEPSAPAEAEPQAAVETQAEATAATAPAVETAPPPAEPEAQGPDQSKPQAE